MSASRVVLLWLHAAVVRRQPARALVHVVALVGHVQLANSRHALDVRLNKKVIGDATRNADKLVEAARPLDHVAHVRRDADMRLRLAVHARNAAVSGDRQRVVVRAAAHEHDNLHARVLEHHRPLRRRDGRAEPVRVPVVKLARAVHDDVHNVRPLARNDARQIHPGDVDDGRRHHDATVIESAAALQLIVHRLVHGEHVAGLRAAKHHEDLGRQKVDADHGHGVLKRAYGCVCTVAPMRGVKVLVVPIQKDVVIKNSNV